MSAPVVLLTATTKIIDGMRRVRLNESYVKATVAAGLTPLIVPPVSPDAIEPMLAAAQGVVLTGGEDVDPVLYGAQRRKLTQPSHAARDACEIAVARRARELRLPTLAICRGIQVANVALGGTLVQDISDELRSDVQHDQSDLRASRVHSVNITEHSRLHQIFGATTIDVNSSHHQALDRVADGLAVTARSPDGVIEGAEWTRDEWWMVGVQWHPEELNDDARDWDRRLFRAFAEVVRG